LDQIANPPFPLPNVILVPQGAEYRAVRRGMGALPLSSGLLRLCAIPMGGQAVCEYLHEYLHEYLEQWLRESLPDRPAVLVLGFAGSLSSHYRVGDVVVYQECCAMAPGEPLQTLECDRSLTQALIEQLTPGAQPIRGLTSDRIITQAREKQTLGQTYNASVVDMEGFAILSRLHPLDIPVAMVRVISDRYHQDLPNLNCALNAQGQLAPLPLSRAMLKHPLRAINLIHGSLKSLPVLSHIAMKLYGAEEGDRPSPHRSEAT